MPAYFFQRALDMTSSQFDEEMTSMRTLYKTAQGSQTAVQYLRELAEDDDSFNPVQLMQGAGRTKRLMPGRMYMFNYRNPISKSRLPTVDASVDRIFHGFQSSLNFWLFNKNSFKRLNKYFEELASKNDSPKIIIGFFDSRIFFDI